MTDDHTDDTHDAHETHDTASHDLPEGEGYEQPIANEGETWRGEPVDDFSDDPAATALSEEEGQHTEEETVEASNKRGTFLPMAIVAGGVLFLGIIAYMLFGGMFHSTSAPALRPVASMPSPSPALAPKSGMMPVVPTPEQQAASPTPMNQTGVATPTKTATEPSAQLPMAPPAASDIAMAPATAPLLPPSPDTANGTQIQPPMTAPSPAPAATAVALPPAVVAHPDTPSADDRITALTARLDNLQKALDQSTRQLDAINDKLVSPPPVAPPSPLIDDRLQRIEQKLTQLEHTAPTPTVETPAPMASASSEAKDQEMPMIKDVGTKGVGTTKPPAHTTKHHKAVKTAARASRHHHVKTSEKTRWVLRAATPTEAWVAKNGTTSELRPVQIGDNLPGIGHVIAIHQDTSGWVLEGTKGTVH